MTFFRPSYPTLYSIIGVAPFQSQLIRTAKARKHAGKRKEPQLIRTGRKKNISNLYTAARSPLKSPITLSAGVSSRNRQFKLQVCIAAKSRARQNRNESLIFARAVAPENLACELHCGRTRERRFIAADGVKRLAIGRSPM